MQCSIQRAFFSKSLPFQTARTFSAGSIKAKKTTLENGVTIISPEQAEQAPLGSVGVFVATGSSTENHDNHGCSHYLRRFLYKGTNRTSGLRLTRTVENLLATFQSENNVEYLSYKSTFPQENLGDALSILGDVLRPKLSEWEFRDVRSLVQHDVNERSANLDQRVEDILRHTAFGGVGLGRSVLCPQYNVNQLYPEHVAEYILGHVVGSNITIVGNVADHEQLVEQADNGFGDLPKEAAVDVAPADESVYYGGSRLDSNSPTNVYAQAYEGVASNSKEALSQAIFAEILGASNRLPQPTGSRLGKALNFSGVEANTFVLPGKKSLFGVQAVSTSESVASLAETVNNHLANPESITEEEFNRAKNIVLAEAGRALDTRHSSLDALYNSQGVAGGDVTLGDVQKFASGLSSGKRATVYASGNLSGLPSFAH